MKVSANMLYGFLSGFIIIRGVKKECPEIIISGVLVLIVTVLTVLDIVK